MKMPAILLLIALLLLGCSRPMDDDSVREPSSMVRNQWGMEFVLIPASGEDWKTHCESNDIDSQPISSFYIQRSELSRLEFAAAFPNNLRANLRKDLHPSQTIPSWIDAVRLAHAMSVDDPSFDYRLPTVAEWRYTYYLLQRGRSTELAESIQDMTGENWEFAVRTKMPTPEAAGNTHDPSFHSESFVLTGSPPDSEHSTFKHYASPTPATGDDGIDEYTGVRLVLMPDSDLDP